MIDTTNVLFALFVAVTIVRIGLRLSKRLAATRVLTIAQFGLAAAFLLSIAVRHIS
jgi:hypothetical protein